MRLVAAILALVFLQDAPLEVLVGTLQRDDRTGELSVGGAAVSIAETVAASAPLVGKRVQIIGRRPKEAAPVEATVVNELEPAEKDLVLRVDVKAEWGEPAEGDRVLIEVCEYQPNALHQHPGLCKSHAWVRARAQGAVGQSGAGGEFPIPAYKSKGETKVFVRASAPRCASRESMEFSWTGKRWIDGDLNEVEGPRRIELGLNAP